MIEKQGRERFIICDGCDDDFGPYPVDEFNVMIAEAKGDGWSIQPHGEGHWTHKCPGCLGDRGNRVENARRMFGL